MSTTRGSPRKPADEELQQHLYRGSELLSEGKVIEAKEHLEKAYQLDPKSEKGRSLLGLAYFKLGMFDQAAEIYEKLVSENPVDPTLRVNLGLVFFKTNLLEKAIREFEIATDLSPDHKKAHNYLALALAQGRLYARAQEHFVLAGNDAMAEKMTKLLAQPKVEEEEEEEEAPSPAPPEPPLNGHPVTLPSAREQMWFKDSVSETPKTLLFRVEGQPAPAPSLEAPRAPEPAPAKPPEVKAPAEPESASVSLEQLAASARISPEGSSSAFQVKPDLVTIVVNGEMLTRVFGLIATSGTLKLEPEMKRYRGRPTEQTFGHGDDQMVRAQGKGVLLVEPRTCTFLAVDLGNDSAYFREEVVFAFEEQVSFDNGRVPSESGMDLDLVHLRGSGKVLLRLPGPLRSMPVVLSRPVTVPVENLAGWQGNLNPRVVALVAGESGKALRAGVELSGEGFALFSAPLG